MQEHLRLLPSAPLAPLIAHYWWVRWDVAEAQTFESIPHPVSHLVIEGPSFHLHGPAKTRFRKALSGQGWALGIKFRPAMFRSFAGLVKRAERADGAAHDLFPDATDWVAAVRETPSPSARIAVIEEWLTPRFARCSPIDAEVFRLRDLIEEAAVEPTLRRVEQLSRRTGWSVRQLQRRCAREVGLSPKWILRVYRLHEAIARLEDEQVSFAALAQELGYADQAHFARDFKAITGKTPSQVATKC